MPEAVTRSRTNAATGGNATSISRTPALGRPVQSADMKTVTLDQLPLSADERSLSEALLGRANTFHGCAVVPLLERRGFPKSMA